MAWKIRHTDKIGTILLIAFSVAVFVITADWREGIGGDPGPAFFPRLVAGLIGFFAIIQLGLQLRQEPDVNYVDIETIKAVAVPLFLTFGYLVVMPYTGYITGTLVFVFLLFKISGLSSDLMALSLTVVATMVMYYIFMQFLSVPLPTNPVYPIERTLPRIPFIVVNLL